MVSNRVNIMSRFDKDDAERTQLRPKLRPHGS